MGPKIVIVGTGLSGLMLARMIRKYKGTATPILFIEKESKVGGQFGSIHYEKYGWFDFGMHIYYEACIPELDELFTSLLPAQEWNILEGNKKDIAGIYFNGRLQLDTPYPDLRPFHEEKRKRYIGEILFNGSRAIPAKDGNAYQLLSDHFGKEVTDDVFVPILQKLYEHHPENLAKMATLLTTINRVALFDATFMTDLMKSDEIRSRICYPNQLTLPPYRKNDQRGFYPRQYGMFRVLEKLQQTLIEACTFKTSSQIIDLKINADSVQQITYQDGNGLNQTEAVKEIYWTAGLPPLASLLKLDVPKASLDKREPAIYVNLIFPKNPHMGLLYYFYCFDKGFRTFRVTNYTNYCPDASTDRGYPVCMELWPSSDDPKNEKELIQLALHELRQFKVIGQNVEPLFGAVEKVHGGGFPVPTLRNMRYLDNIREMIKKKNITNLISLGVLAEPNQFFMKDVLEDAWRKVKANT